MERRDDMREREREVERKRYEKVAEICNPL